MKLNRLFFVYLSALSLILLSVLASMFLTEISSDDLVDDAAKINLAGRQRMLSQRIVYLAQDLSMSQGIEAEQTRAELRMAINELQSAVHLFEASHARLSDNPMLSAETRDLYFRPDADGKTLDQRVSGYLLHARGILQDPTDQASLAGLLMIERAGLLRDLDAVVANIEQTSNARVRVLQTLERASLLIAIAIILIEVLFVFLPGHRFLRKTHDDLQERNLALQRAHDASEALRREQAEFTYSVSHDLKSPANTIGLILTELRLEEQERLSPDGQEMLDEALATVARIGGQVEDILQYAWATTGEAETEIIDLPDVVNDAIARLNHEIEASGACVTAAAAGRFNGYARQVASLVENLLSNAIKFRAPDRQPQIDIRAQLLPDGSAAEITVTDNGIGIAPQDREQVFQLFRKLHLRSEYEGTGLGLATCKRIADNHKGSITLGSVPGGGSCFRVVLFDPEAGFDSITIKEAA